MKVGKWSTTAGNNNATPPDGWPEGQAPSTVNDCARENMAAIRTLVSDLQYVDLGHTPSYLSATTFSLGTLDVANFEIGRRVKLFDATTLYGTINSVSGTFVSVRLDSGALTVSLSSVALGVLRNTAPALPDAATTQQNVVINGDMDIWQRGAFFGNPDNFAYTADRFMYEKFGMTGSGNVLQKPQSVSVDMVPTVFQAGRYLNNALAFAVSATQSVLVNSSYSMISYIVEGRDLRPIAYQPLGLGFWVNATHSGIYSVAIRNGNVDYSYVTEFTVTAVNVMQHYFLQLPPTLDGVTWAFDSTPGLRISWVLAAGSDYMVSNVNSWTAGNLVASPNQINLFENVFGQFTLTGVTLKPGWSDVPVAPRRYGDELGLCQRYYWRGLPAAALNTNSYTAGAITTWACNFPVAMRALPNMTLHVPGTAFIALTDLGADGSTVYGFRLLATATVPTTNANMTFNVSTDYIEADAEL